MGDFLFELVATLLRYARSTSDPSVAAALLDKATELNERVQVGTASATDASPEVPDEQTDQSA